MRVPTIDRLTRAAIIYRLAIAEGRSPIDELKARLDVTEHTAKRLVYRARRAGLLAQHRGVFDKPD